MLQIKTAFQQILYFLFTGTFLSLVKIYRGSLENSWLFFESL